MQVKQRTELGWEAKTRFKELVQLMVDADMEMVKQEAHLNSYSNPNLNVRSS